MQDRAVMAEPGQGAGTAGPIPRAGRCSISARRSVADLETDRGDRGHQPQGRNRRTDQRGILSDIEGVVLLDGTWSQAKALWWRNAWMLKCQRVILASAAPVALWQVAPRAAPRGPFNLEAAALLISRLEGRSDIKLTLESTFQALLAKYRQAAATMPEVAPPKPRRDWRRRKHA